MCCILLEFARNKNEIGFNLDRRNKLKLFYAFMLAKFNSGNCLCGLDNLNISPSCAGDRKLIPGKKFGWFHVLHCTPVNTRLKPHWSRIWRSQSSLNSTQSHPTYTQLVHRTDLDRYTHATTPKSCIDIVIWAKGGATYY